MQRNVIQCLRRQRARAQWRPTSTQYGMRRCYSEVEETKVETIGPERVVIEQLKFNSVVSTSYQPLDATTEDAAEEESEASSHENELYQLRLADQMYLAKTKGDTEKLIRAVSKAREEILSLPTTVHKIPEIPAYTMSYARAVYTRAIPELSERTIEAAEHVREHLVDLQWQQYGRLEDTPLKLFDKEIDGWDQEQVMEKRSAMDLEEEALKERLERNIGNAYEKTKDTISRHSQKKGAPKTPMPSFSTGVAAGSKAAEQDFKDATPIVTEGKGQDTWGSGQTTPLEPEAIDPGWKDAEALPVLRKQSSVRWVHSEKGTVRTHHDIRKDEEARKAELHAADGKDAKPAQRTEGEDSTSNASKGDEQNSKITPLESEEKPSPEREERRGQTSSEASTADEPKPLIRQILSKETKPSDADAKPAHEAKNEKDSSKANTIDEQRPKVKRLGSKDVHDFKHLQNSLASAVERKKK